MKKILLTLTTVLMASFAMAQDVLWSEDFSGYEIGKDADGKDLVVVPSGGEFNYVCTNGASTTKLYAENLAGGEAPELLISKNDSKNNIEGGTFSFTVPMNGKSGDMFFAFKANKSVTVTATGATAGTQQKSGNDIIVPITVAAGTESITITVQASTTSNVRFDNAKLYQGEAKKPAGLSWGTASREVTIGGEENKFPTLTNEANLPITYTSSEETVATINAEGVITLVAAGVTVITAEFAGNDAYEAAKVSYTLTVKAAPTVDLTNTPETAYSTTEAIALIEAGEGLDKKVYVKGTIKEVTDISWDASLATGYYGNATYTITDGTSDLIIFRGYYLKGEKFTEENQIQDGDEVIVYGKLVEYNGTKEMTTGSSIYSINGETGEVEEDPYDVVGNGTIENPYNAEDVVWLFKHEQAPTENVWVKGTILGNVNTSNGNTQVPTVWEIEDNNGDGKIDQKDCAEGDFLVLPSNLSVGNDKAHVAVQLTYETAPRNALNLQDHKENLGKDVWVCGKIEKYCNVAGVKSLVDYSFDGTAGINNVNVIVNDNIYNIAGQRVASNYRGIIIMNGKKYIK